MGKLQLSVAIGDYDRTGPLVDGAVQIDAVDPQFMLLEPEEMFFRAFRRTEFDICELSLSSYCVQVAARRVGLCRGARVPFASVSPQRHLHPRRSRHLRPLRSQG